MSTIRDRGERDGQRISREKCPELSNRQSSMAGRDKKERERKISCGSEL
jgi:hypothetical protein